MNTLKVKEVAVDSSIKVVRAICGTGYYSFMFVALAANGVANGFANVEAYACNKLDNGVDKDMVIAARKLGFIRHMAHATIAVENAKKTVKETFTSGKKAVVETFTSPKSEDYDNNAPLEDSAIGSIL